MNFSEILNLFKQGKGTVKSHMKNLIEMAAADGNLIDVEFDLLKSIAKQNGISEGQLKDIRKNPSGVKFEVPKDETERFKQLYDLVQMMSIDNDVHPEEAKLCNLFAIRFGYQRAYVKDLVEVIRANIKNGQNATETMKRVSLLIS
jgi:uncharacterized tellurite resistance protein B-like protein